MSELGQTMKLITLLGGTMRGQYYRFNKKATVEGSLTFTPSILKDRLNRFVDEQLHTVGGSIKWSNGSTISYRVERRGTAVVLRLIYTTTKPSGDKIESDYPVLMTYTVPHFGGRRWWFICPLSVNGKPCRRRVGKLYSPHSEWFGCRHCFDLTYESTRESELYRAGRERDKIIERLGGDSSGIFPRLPWKPPNMHWTTYSRLATRFQELEQAELRALNIFWGPEIEAEAEERVRARMEDRLLMMNYESEQRERQRYPTLGEIAKSVGVPFDFAREARKRGLVREDKGRGTRRRRYRRKLSSWLEKLYLLNQNGYSWDDIEAWTRRRWATGHKDERRWPRGFTEV